jgi:hypothetical protein
MKPVGDGAKRVRTWSYVQCVQTAGQVGLEVVNVFQAHGHADHALRDAGGLALRFVRRPCDVLAGWVMRVLVSPRLEVIEHMRVCR